MLYIRTDESLESAGGSGVSGEVVVRLETNLTRNARFDFTLVTTSTREERAAELHLDEDLRVERAEGRVEGRAGDRGVDVVGRGGRVAVV